MQQPRINKDLILREKMAIERTVMANDRTLLSFVRTALYFTVAGLSLNELLTIRYGRWVEWGCFFMAAILAVAGVLRYRAGLQKIKESRMQVGNYRLELEES